MMVVWLDQAEDDVQAILEYIQSYSSPKAVELFHDFYDSADQLERFPEMGRMVPELGRKEVRELIIDKKYRLIYKVGVEHIFIIAVKHGRQNLDVEKLEHSGELEG